MAKILDDMLVSYRVPKDVTVTNDLVNGRSQSAILEAGLELKKDGARIISACVC